MSLTTRLYVPAYPLREFVEFFFYYDGYKPAHNIDRLIPDGEVRLLFDLSDQTQPIYDNDTIKVIQTCRKAWFAGLRTEPITIPSGRDSKMLIVQFRRGRAAPFIDAPLSELTNLVVDAEAVFGHDILAIRDRLLEAGTVERKFSLLDGILLERYRSRLVVCPFVDFAVSRISADPAHCRIHEIAATVGYTQKHLIDLFARHVGVPPKSFLRVIRFQKVIREIESRRYLSWVDLVHDCGFYDQSHFISDFKSFSGLTPTEYLRRKGDVMNYIPVGGAHEGFGGQFAGG